MNAFKLCSFDVFNTLIKAKHVGQVYSDTATLIGIISNPQHLNNAFKTVFNQYKHMNKNNDFWRLVICNTFLLNNIKLPQSTDYSLFIKAYTSSSAYTLVPGAKEGYSIMKSLNIPMLVISNSDERFKSILREFGFNFTEYIFTADTLLNKSLVSSWDLWYKQYNQKYNLTKKQWLHIGDDLIEDKQIPESIGITSKTIKELTS